MNNNTTINKGRNRLVLFLLLCLCAFGQVKAQSGTLLFKHIGNMYYGTRPFNLSDSLVYPNRLAAFALVNTQPQVATLTGTTFNPNGVGLVMLKVSVWGTDTTLPPTIILDTFRILKAIQVIQFDTLQPRRVGETFGISARVLNRGTGLASGLTVQFALENTPSHIATLNTATRQITTYGTGLVTVRATQNGNNFFSAADTARQYFYVSQGVQTWGVGNSPIGNYYVGAGNINLANLHLTTNAGHPVSVNLVSGPFGVSITNNILSIPSNADTGMVHYTASAPGDSNWLPLGQNGTFLVLARTTAINSSLNISLALCPNPATDFIVLNGLLSEPCKISVCNALGQTVWQQHFTQSTHNLRIEIGHLLPGIYLLSAEQNGAVTKIKLVKE